MKKILFICHGNICRSTMAEFVMKHLVTQAGQQENFHIASAATSRDDIGADTYVETKKQLDLHGIPYRPRHARQMTPTDYEAYDLLIGMDQANLHNMLRIAGGDPEGKIHRLLSFAGKDQDIADPWYTRDFVTTYREVDEGCRALLDNLLNRKENKDLKK